MEDRENGVGMCHHTCREVGQKSVAIKAYVAGIIKVQNAARVT